SRHHAGKAGAVTESAGEKLRSALGRERAIQPDSARQLAAREEPLLRGARRFRRAARATPDFLAQRGLPLLERHRRPDPGGARPQPSGVAPLEKRRERTACSRRSRKDPPPWPCGQLRWCPALWQVGPWWPASGFPVRRDYSRG